MKNHWLEKARTRKQRKTVIDGISKMGVMWFTLQGLSPKPIAVPKYRKKVKT